MLRAGSGLCLFGSCFRFGLALLCFAFCFGSCFRLRAIMYIEAGVPRVLDRHATTRSKN